MTIIEALLLGLIQGITEFIPVSSSGHAAIIENLLHINSESGLLFEALAHLTVLAAVIGALRKEIKKLLMEFCRSMYDVYENVRIYFHNRDKKDARRYKKVISNNYRKLFLLLVIASIPTALESYILQDMTRLAGDNLLAPGMGLFITGILLLGLAFLLYKLGLGESQVNLGIMVTYIISCLAGGFYMGRKGKNRRFLWGMGLGFGYAALLWAVTYLTERSGGDLKETVLMFFICVLGGALGGMLS